MVVGGFFFFARALLVFFLRFPVFRVLLHSRRWDEIFFALPSSLLPPYFPRSLLGKFMAFTNFRNQSYSLYTSCSSVFWNSRRHLEICFLSFFVPEAETRFFLSFGSRISGFFSSRSRTSRIPQNDPRLKPSRSPTAALLPPRRFLRLHLLMPQIG